MVKHPEAGERTQKPVQRRRMRADRGSQFLGAARRGRQLVGDAELRGHDKRLCPLTLNEQRS